MGFSGAQDKALFKAQGARLEAGEVQDGVVVAQRGQPLGGAQRHVLQGALRTGATRDVQNEIGAFWGSEGLHNLGKAASFRRLLLGVTCRHQ